MVTDLQTAKQIVDALNQSTQDAIKTMNKAKRQARTNYADMLREITLKIPPQDQTKLVRYYENNLVDWNEA